MKYLSLLILLPLFMVACSSTPSHEEQSKVHDLSETQLEQSKDISGGDKVGIRENTFKVQRKVQLAEELRDLENEVYGMEYEIYGNRKYGTKGLYGAYRDCSAEVNSIKYGGSGKMKPIEKKDRVIKEDHKFKFGVDKNGDLIGVSEEYLSERIERFKKYKDLLVKRLDEYETKVRICENDLKQAKIKAKKQEKKAK